MTSLLPRLFGRAGGDPASPAVGPESPIDLALDAVADLLRTLGQYPLDQEEMDPSTFTGLCEQWAQHVLLGAPPPGSAAPSPAQGSPNRSTSTTSTSISVSGSSGARRDWAAVRTFVRDYCRTSVTHTRAVMGDLRQVVWMFVHSLQQGLAKDQEADERLQQQLDRLQKLARDGAVTDLKGEVMNAVVLITQSLDERRARQQATMAELGQRVRVLGNQLDAARREGETDALTRLYNRKAFDEYLEHTLSLVRTFSQDACLVFVDADNFKQVNDTYGHTTGDEMLRLLSDSVARVFLRKNDFVARYGGDELAVVLRETSVEESMSLLERLVKATRSIELAKDGAKVVLRASIGVAPALASDDPTRWLDRADRALYAAKQAGRDQLVLLKA
ncbi:MAG: GGDEF domain-containing protein [Myxococcales bacterium]